MQICVNLVLIFFDMLTTTTEIYANNHILRRRRQIFKNGFSDNLLQREM